MSGEESEQEHSKPENPEWSAPIIVNGKNETYKSYTCKKIANYSCLIWEWIKKFSEPITIVTLLLFGATVALYLATRDLVHDAQHTAERQLRPYVWVEMTTVKYPPKAPDRIGIGFRITNSGQTWAQNVTIRTAIIPRQFNVEYDPWDRAQWKVSPPIVLGPRQPLGLQLDNIWLVNIPAIFRDEKGFDYAISITYDDIVTQPPTLRRTQVSQRLNADKEGGTSFGYLPTHNCADDDCP